MKEHILTSLQHKNVTDWLIDLRSGNYIQGRGMLRDKHNKYCCLGVACETQGIERLEANEFSDTCGYIINGKFMDAVPENNWFISTYGFYYGKRMQYVSSDWNVKHYSLTDLNDLKDFDFNQIADVIESNILNNCIIKD